MATAVRRHVIVNPHRRRNKAKGRRRKNRARHLSAKQIRYFGTPAQKAGLKRSRSAKRAAAHRKRSVPKKRNRRSVAHRTRRRTNPGDILSLALGNPGGKKRRGMAARKHHKRRAASHRRNPGRRHRRVNRRHYRRNPAPHITDLFTQSIFIIGGAVGSKILTQAVLGANNVGIFGYAGNAAATAVLAMLSHAFVKNPKVRDSIIAGGAVQIVLRVISDYTPFGKYTAQLGMGDYLASNFVTPQRYVDALNSAQVEVPAGWGPGVTAVPAAGMGSLYGGNGSCGGPLYG